LGHARLHHHPDRAPAPHRVAVPAPLRGEVIQTGQLSARRQAAK
jgi:hypothetical protein